MRFRDRVRQFRERFRPLRMVDPVFGAIRFERTKGWNGWWTQDQRSGGYGFRIFGRDSGPSEKQRELFKEFERRRAEILAAMEGRMFEEYNKIREIEREGYGSAEVQAFDKDFPEVRQAAEIWRIAELASVEVYGGKLDFGLLFEMKWGDPEHVLSVMLRDWKVVDVGKDG